MRLSIVAIITLFLLQVAADTYLFALCWNRFRRITAAKIQLWQGAFFLIFFITLVCLPKRTDDDTMLQLSMWMLFIYLSVYVSKLTFILFDLLASLPRLWHRRRWRPLTNVGIIAALGAGGAMWWGALVNRHNIRVNEVTVKIAGLPQSFAGYRIAQISDLHVGTWSNDTTFVSTLVDRVNALNPDLIVFTGDIVNRQSTELTPFIIPLTRLQARDGVLSILGNHDYGDYRNWQSAADKEANMEMLMDQQIEMGWELLTNNAITIYGQSGADSLTVIGVENWGDPPFHTYGDLLEAYPTPQDSAVKILLSHNPAHWQQEIAPRDTMNIALTLSGHTHAMQVSAGHISPAVWRYKDWGGLYASDDGRRQLYVNIGAGCVGVPMRLGATPEITILTLIPAKNK